jgi:hypothetical protein
MASPCKPFTVARRQSFTNAEKIEAVQYYYTLLENRPGAIPARGKNKWAFSVTRKQLWDSRRKWLKSGTFYDWTKRYSVQSASE